MKVQDNDWITFLAKSYITKFDFFKENVRVGILIKQNLAPEVVFYKSL